MDSRRKNKIQTGTKSKRRGRPRAFDSGVALLAAQDTFLRKGYSAATLDDLSSAMGINRPSLYGAFTGKQALYQQALDGYVRHMSGLFRAALEEKDLAAALHKLYSTALDAFVNKDGEAVGCLVACTAVTEAVEHAPLRRQTKSILDEIDLVVARRLVRAVEDGQLPAATRIKALARLAVGVLHTLALRARAGTSRKVLDEMAADAVAMLTR